MSKSIVLSKKTWKRLKIYKINNELKNMNEVVELLLNKEEKKVKEK